MIDIQPLAAAGHDAVEAVLDAAFGKDRHGRTAYRLRTGTQAIHELSFAAFDGDTLVGTLQSWPVALTNETPGTDPQPLIMVGPVAVLPERQRSGIGRILMEQLVRTADANGEDALMLIGDPEYYDRLFGFNAVHTGGWDVPGPVERHRLLARLTSQRLHGLKGMLGPKVRTDAAALR